MSSRLRASLGSSEGAAGHLYSALLVTNRGSVTCFFDGYPGVSFTAGRDAHQVGAPAQHDSRYRATRVMLAPGATAHTTAKVTNFSAYEPKTCRPVRATGFRAYPPGSTGSLLIHDPQTVCSKPGIQGFAVTVMRTGTSPD